MGNSIGREKALAEVPNLKDTVIIVTGGNSGIGFEAASIFLEKGATVVLACRSEGKAKDAVSELQKMHENASVSYLLLDVSSKDSIENFIAEFKSKFNKLNILVNNAGVAINRKYLLSSQRHRLLMVTCS